MQSTKTSAQLFQPFVGPALFFPADTLKKRNITSLLLLVHEVRENSKNTGQHKKAIAKIKVFVDSLGRAFQQGSFDLKTGKFYVYDTVLQAGPRKELFIRNPKYDKDNNLIELTDILSTERKEFFRYDSMKRQVYHYWYNTGERSEIFVPQFYRIITRYDSSNQVAEEDRISGEYTGDTSKYADHNVTFYEYDDNYPVTIWDLTFKSGSYENKRDPQLYTTRIEYQNGLPLRATFVSGSNMNEWIETIVDGKNE
jgi:hypothetical protein